jgi:CRP/FNR family transcriptional regulator
VVREQRLLLLLGRMTAEERVAAFLRDLAGRYAERGQSPNEFTLPMAREDIGNYLGLTLETVSRCFSRLKHAGVLDVDNRHIRIRDAQRLLSGAGSYRQTSNGVVTH